MGSRVDPLNKIGLIRSPAIRRLRDLRDSSPDDKPYESMLEFHTSGGLAAVWAEKNTRDALYPVLASTSAATLRASGSCSREFELRAEAIKSAYGSS